MTDDNNYKKGSLGWLREQAKEDGFDSIRNWQIWKIEKREQNIFYKELEERYGKEFADLAIQNKCKIRRCILNAGCKTEKEYNKLCNENTAKNAGFNNINEWQLKRLHDKGICTPMSDDENLAQHFGIEMGERLFKKWAEQTMFDCVNTTKYLDNGIDFICKNPRQEFIDRYPQFKLDRNKEYKIQLKLRCLRRRKSNTANNGYN